MDKKIFIILCSSVATAIKIQPVVQTELRRIQVFDYSWLIETTDIAFVVYSRYSPYLNIAVDKIFITEIKSDYYGWLSRSVWDWIKENPSFKPIINDPKQP